MTALESLPPSDGRPELLVLRAIKLGDLLVAVPALRALRRAFPDHRITLATTAWLAPVVELVSGVDVHLAQHGLDHPIAVPTGTVDVAVNLHGAGPESSDLIAALAPRRVIGHADPTHGYDGPEWPEGVHERDRWADLLTWHGIPADADDVAIERPAAPPAAADGAVVHVGAFHGARHWPTDRFAEVVRGLRARGLDVVLTGGSADVERAAAVADGAGLAPEAVLAGSLELQDFAGVAAAARVVVTVDTGAAHLATAYGVPSVVLFGPAPPEAWGPPASGPHVVLTDASVRRGDVFAEDPDPAILAVQASDVLDAVDRLGVARETAQPTGL
ncbi:glycosyltransferase family 9 protein [Curtobacterium sp. MCLR17_036]|uniref:glycosyltransferase family 9 protein n=1 Tax=Curtobacterium sp. MCLR17_036 TaxID=2175620 RepID=UPI000DAA11EB|nr:glycosyltransferase family 9 protein [Curtobacterium sp. MCLR17_036]WIE63367.1 glycosyltransferase family 9 protein [Curtobacterium sp. MCLR17_036]